ncbi:ATP-dependent Clp protease ATP-binding subunit [[Brevibacterium] frigoritolerans]|nr:ATP-dependent Clp protease ATP-binding subunit [Peribacillus frigoritolerans]
MTNFKENPNCSECKLPKPKHQLMVLMELDERIICVDCFEKNEEKLIDEIKKRYPDTKFGIRNPFESQQVDVDSFLDNLNEEVLEDFDPVLFRDEELERVVQILLRKTKNNPVLIGEAGVGKTKVASLLAYNIVKGKIPRLKGYTVYSLNIASLMSGTKYRGEFEAKVQKLIEKMDSKSILFMDEMHLMMGAGSSSSSDIDLANLLKPYLTQGKLKVIGATTLSEFRSIEKDPAITRRFQTVKVEPLNEEQTLVILEKLCPIFELHHEVKVSPECLKEIVDLSGEYIKNRCFPEKAIDVLDEACSLVSLQRLPIEEVNDLQHQFVELITTLDIKNAAAIQEQLNDIKKEGLVSSHIVAKVVETMTNIPVTQLTTEEKQNLLNLEVNLKKRVIGQEEAVSTMAKVVRRSRMKVKRLEKPTVLFFAGPTGVGKTESVKALAECLFKDKNMMHRFDMSEYMDKHSVSKLIGTAPGFIGYEEEGQLTEKVRNNPYSIVLLDEFEKAHPEIANVFLQLFGEGHLTDSKGRTVDFKNTIFILTSNIGVGEIQKVVGFGSEPIFGDTITALEKAYRPEFINRIDEVITFNSLSKENIAEILELRLNEYQKSLLSKGIELKLNDDAKRYLVKEGYSPTMGARPLSRIITKEIEDLVVDHLLLNDDIETLFITETNGHLQIS